MSSEPKIFLPKTPVEFSPSLIQKLDSSVESDYTRSQYSDKHIQDLVNKELKKQYQEATNTLKETLQNVPDISSNKFKDVPTSNILKEKLASLIEKLEQRPQPQQWSEQVTSTRDSLITCFKANKDKPLKCHEEFERFNEKVREFVQK